MLTYLNEVDKHAANYACSGFGEKSAASFPTTKTRFALQIKALSCSTGPCKEEFQVCFFFFFLMVCQVETSNGCFLKSFTFMMRRFVIGPELRCQSSLLLVSVWIRLTPPAHQMHDFSLCTNTSSACTQYMKPGLCLLSLHVNYFITFSVALLNWVWYCMLDLVWLNSPEELRRKKLKIPVIWTDFYHTAGLLYKTTGVYVYKLQAAGLKYI